jgi:hypothetical protein
VDVDGVQEEERELREVALDLLRDVYEECE